MAEWVRRRTPVADRVPLRLRLAWNCLRGRPVAYRIRIENGGLVIDRPRSMVVEIRIVNAPSAAVQIPESNFFAKPGGGGWP